MIPLKDYYVPESLKEVADALSDPALDHESHRDDVNRLTLNLVIKYLAQYLDIHEGNVASLRKRVRDVMQHKTDTGGAGLMSMMFGGGVANNDLFGLQSLADVHSTAAIVKEIVFGGRYEKDDDVFLGIDLGAGTGILSLAMLLSARRREFAETMVLGVEKEVPAVRSSRRVLDPLVRDGEVVRIERGDIRDPQIWRIPEQFPCFRYWVSETISCEMPPIVVNEHSVRVEQSEHAMLAQIFGGGFDPFPEVLASTVRYRREFLQEVREGRVAMFPDIVNGRFTPNFKLATIKLRTAPVDKELPLTEISEEFDLGYEPLLRVQPRFPNFEAQSLDEMREYMAGFDIAPR